jgi:predicted amidohydrolase
VNSGIVADDCGSIVARYEKVRLYGSELGRGIVGGSTFGRFECEIEFVVLICSDLWFSDSFSKLQASPDAILIPSFSITQKRDPNSARQLWRHMAIARAYEYAAYVGVSDWAHPCQFDGLSAAGVSGIANPRPDGDCFFSPNQDAELCVHELNFARLDAFRKNRAVRGFLWNPASPDS